MDAKQARRTMRDSEGSEYDRLFYPFLFEGGKASIEDVLARVRHSTLEKCREVIALRRITLESSGEQIVAAGQAIARAFADGATLLAFGNGGSTTDAHVLVALEQAKKQGLLTVGLAGYDGGKMIRSKAVDFCINSPSDHIPRIQEAQATVYHALLEVIQGAINQAPMNEERET